MIPLGRAFAVPAVHAGVIIVGWILVEPIPAVIGSTIIFLGLITGTLVTGGLAKQLSGAKVGEPFVAFASMGILFGVVALYFTLLLGFAYESGSGRTDWIETQVVPISALLMLLGGGLTIVGWWHVFRGDRRFGGWLALVSSGGASLIYTCTNLLVAYDVALN